MKGVPSIARRRQERAAQHVSTANGSHHRTRCVRAATRASCGSKWRGRIPLPPLPPSPPRRTRLGRRRRPHRLSRSNPLHSLRRCQPRRLGRAHRCPLRHAVRHQITTIVCEVYASQIFRTQAWLPPLYTQPPNSTQLYHPTPHPSLPEPPTATCAIQYSWARFCLL